MPGVVYLRVNRRLVLLPNPPTESQPNPASSPPLNGTGNLNVIAGPLLDIQNFAGTSVDWLIRMAKLILDPRGAGVLYTFQTGTVQYWLNHEMTDSWRQVGAGEELVSTIYEYRRLDGQLMDLTRICDRHTDLVALPTREELEFRDTFLAQHTECIISRASLDGILAASHLIPACLGDDVVQYIFERFTGLSNPVTKHHQSTAVPLNLFFNAFVTAFNLGFWNRGGVCLFSLRTLPCINVILCRMNTKFTFSYRTS
jgi:hypothetical protein